VCLHVYEFALDLVHISMRLGCSCVMHLLVSASIKGYVIYLHITAGIEGCA
jgi:hypothetical protein